MLRGEQERQSIAKRFEDLMNRPFQAFPASRGNLQAPSQPGVYVIYSSRKALVLYVGRNLGAQGSLHRRLTEHLTRARFTKNIRKCSFRCLVVKNQRQRTLLEAYAIGHLCPSHLPTGEPEFDKRMRSGKVRARPARDQSLPANAVSTLAESQPAPKVSTALDNDLSIIALD